MRTIPHKNMKEGYSLRVSKRLPEGAANLAYVYNEALSPERNISLEDESKKIVENGNGTEEVIEYVAYPDESSMLVTLEGVDEFATEEVLVTDEYDVSGKEPLYWHAFSKGLFDARNGLVSFYKKGFDPSLQEKRFEEMSVAEREEMLYLGQGIEVVNRDGTSLSSEKKVKVKLFRQGTDPFSYGIEVFTNFVSTPEESYMLKYRKWENGRSTEVVESMNAEPLFERVEKSEVDALTTESEKMLKKFAVVKDGLGRYRVYAKAPMVIVDDMTRPPHEFTYQVTAELEAKLGKDNPGELKVGYVFINDTESGANVYDLSSVGKKVFSDSNVMKPEFLSFENAHSRFENLGTDSVEYWVAELSMPASHYLDYDVIVISGYGDFDMSRYRQQFEAFLENGGTVVVDNNGVGPTALNFIIDGRQTFLRNIGFGAGLPASAKTYPESKTKNRYFVGQNANEVGRVNASWMLGEGESSSSWQPLLGYANGNVGVGWRKHGNGRIILSSVGLMSAALMSSTETMRFLSNLLLWLSEERHVVSPSVKEFVHNRNSLFRKEYKDAQGRLSYYDDRSDEDATQLVAKKRLADKVSDALSAYLPKGFEQAKGLFQVKVNADSAYPVSNGGFEIVSPSGTTSWTAAGSTVEGWSARIFAGTGTFRQEDTGSKQGSKSMSVESASGHLFLEQDMGTMPAGTYQVSAWISTKNVSGVGGKVGFYRPDGQKILASSSVTGTSGWKKQTIVVTLTEATAVMLRVGFIDGNGSGKVFVDDVVIENSGSVKMTPIGNGSNRLYAYASLSKGQGLDFQNMGFDTEDVVIHHPVIEGNVRVTAYVYQWNNDSLLYQQVRGDSVVHPFRIRKNDGRIVLGKVASLLPPTKEGAMWADKNNIYYEFEIGDGYEDGIDRRHVNLEVYDPTRKKSFYTKDGQAVISHFDLYGEVGSAESVVELWTNYYTLQATKKQFTLRTGNESGVHVTLPGTDDVRERWHLRVRNGSFIKNSWSVEDIDNIQASGRYDLASRTLGNMLYTIPSYEEQAFYPEFGVMSREEVARYVDAKTIQVDRVPMVVKEREVVLEELESVDAERKVFQSVFGKWNRKAGASIYLDEGMNGTNVKLTDGFDIDHETGRVFFDEPKTGIVRASYTQDNFKVSRRKYMNESRKGVALSTSDRKSWGSKEENWLSTPAPILYKGFARPENVIPASEYDIDYRAGQVVFKEEQSLRVYADFQYFVEEELEVEDVDVSAGLIRLKSETTFKDELYVEYLYREDYVDYKGYYDEDAGRFVALDLNPSMGHIFTLTRESDGVATYEDVETERLVNKEVFLYLLPSRIEFSGGVVIQEQEVLRHALSEAEWLRIKQGRPEAMLLARVQVRENTTVENTVVMDARRRGGGLREDIKAKDIEKRGGSVEAFWDVGAYDGVAYYEKGVVVIRVPASVLLANGGRLTEEEVIEKVKKNLAYGIYPMVEFI